MAIDAMTTGNLNQQGQAPDSKASPATMEALHMGRFKIGPKIPAAVLEKVGMKVGDTVPKDWDADQVERWNRRGYLVVDGGQARETAQAGAARETRGGGDTRPTRCQAKTNSGKQCKRDALEGSAACSVPAHQKQVAQG